MEATKPLREPRAAHRFDWPLGLPPLLALAALLGLLAAGAPASAQELARLDELLLKGSHNSYHKRPAIAFHPRHRFQHDPLRVQLEHDGVRALELDLHLNRSGELEVYHIALIDGRTHCLAFEACLHEIRAWSDGHRDHEPLMIWLEIKDYAGGSAIDDLGVVDRALRAALGDRLITPDDVRGGHPSLRTALETEGWPTLAESRGRVLFMLIASPEQEAAYTSELRHLRGRAMFVNAEPEQFAMPWAAVAKLSVFEHEPVQRARAAKMLLTATVCVAEMDDTACLRARDQALAAGFNVLLDDYVRPTPERAYFLDVGFSLIAGVRQPRAPDAPQAASSVP